MLPFILLGILQGLTEFLPISSSGHLALAGQFLRVQKPGIVFDIFVHSGTLLSVLWVFRERIFRLVLAPIRRGEDLRLLGLLIAGSIPTGMLGLALDSVAEAAFAQSWAVGVGLLITAAVLFSVERRGSASAKSLEQLSWRDALWVGLAQGIAVLPGISRSGSTIAMGLFCRLRRTDAAEFSFLLFIPAVIGATLLKLGEVFANPEAHNALWGSYLAGTTAAFLSGVIAIRFLIKLLRERSFTPFALYCLVLGLFAVVWHLAKS
ncbi:undecaprenyl-diphosphate phosphatase [Candidatus Acetothermia bacterium]|jgi:undecaprenyl-diphosphatase|nr:undecaprenyl-diphosphate phosphatase [Candidatus Acetothermia bacterium]MCI2431054.1 undecaprenyl-diphosphate phosphatase [Candidatus Acetothermia bacterium]MCI2436950.1 undecaprenyl-diphosphate phosphatase [Candidatus Acetothermia bacterium]